MEKKKKVIIVSAHYLCSTVIAAVKPRKIAKYLNATGRYDIFVITAVSQSDTTGKTSKQPLDMSIMDKEDYISGYTLVPQLNSTSVYRKLCKPFRFIRKGLQKILGIKRERKGKNILYAYHLFDDTSFYRRSKKFIRKNKLWEADIVYSTCGPCAPHYIARYIKKKNPAALWIAEIRDPVYKEDSTPRLFKTYAKNYVKKICKTADVITTLSQGFMDVIDMPDVPAYVVSNGFDPDDAPVVVSNDNKKFILTYAGRLYRKRQDMTALFQVIRELIDEGALDKDMIQIEYAGPNTDVLEQQAGVFCLDSIIHSHGLVHRNKSLEIQNNSNMLLVASWNRKGYTGVLPGKIYEYMMMKKPIVSIVEGDIPNSEIKDVIDRCSLGFCYEQACHDRDYILLKNYIYTQYCQFIKTGSVLFEPNTEEINKYSYPSIVEELERLFYEH